MDKDVKTIFGACTVMIAPVPSRGREGYLTRVRLTVGDVDGWIVLDLGNWLKAGIGI